ncbi:MAG: 50S ribosomal protein L5 [archaeon]
MNAQQKSKSENKMKEIKVEKITLNIGSGVEQENAEKAVLLLSKLSGAKVVKTVTQKRIATWKLRPGLPVGAMVTIRGSKASELLKTLLHAVSFKVRKTSFMKNGFSFGIREYIEIPGVKYDPKIGIIGLEIAVSLARPGFRVKRRKINYAKIHHSHEISPEEAWVWAQKSLGITAREEED